MNDVGKSRSLPDLLRRSTSRFGDSPAVVRPRSTGGNGRSYAELWNDASHGAATLQAHHVRPGQRVLLVAKPGPDWAAAFFAIQTAGAVAVPLPVEVERSVASKVAMYTGAKIAIVEPGYGKLTRWFRRLEMLTPDRLFEGETCIEAERAPDDLALLAFTSGSTGRPRIVQISHDNLLTNLRALAEIREAGPEDAMLATVTPAHLFGLTAGLLGPLACGARVVFPGPPLPNRLLACLREDDITYALTVPALVHALVAQALEELCDTGAVETAGCARNPEQLAAALVSDEDLRRGIRGRIGSQLHTLIVGGAALNPAWAGVLGQLGIRLEVGYGLTETSPIVTTGFAGECPPGSVGGALPGVEVRVDCDGEILVRGPNVMRGYFKNPGASAAVLQDGWLRTGDRGRLDDDGFLFVTGRIKEAMVTASGETIYPDDLEPHYLHPLFAELCVAPVSASDGNDVPVLFVVPESPDILDDRLRDAFADLRAAVPVRLRVSRMVRLEHPLPRTLSGKIRRRLVAQESVHVSGS